MGRSNNGENPDYILPSQPTYQKSIDWDIKKVYPSTIKLIKLLDVENCDINMNAATQSYGRRKNDNSRFYR